MMDDQAVQDRENDSGGRRFLDAIPSPAFVCEPDATIVAFNEAARRWMPCDGPDRPGRRCGDVLFCEHARSVPMGCGSAPACPDCHVRKSLHAAFSGTPRMRQRTHMTLIRRDGARSAVDILISASAVPWRTRDLVLLILEDISDLVELHSLLPICSHCKKIRDDRQYWHEIDQYITRHHDLDFTHTICPDCMRKLYPDAWTDLKAKDAQDNLKERNRSA